MKKVKQYKGFVIAYCEEEECFYIYTKDEWSFGKYFRYPEHEAGTIEEAINFIDSY